MHRSVLLLVSALSVGVFPSCGGGDGLGYPAPQGEPVQLTVIGVDGMEWSVAEALMEAGEMPNLKRLVDDGVGGVLASEVPTFSPVLWTTIATGRSPREHGVLFFSEIDTRTGQPKRNGLPYTSEMRRVPAVWNLVGDAGLSPLVVGWWVSWPAEPVRRGRIVASYAAQAQGAILWKSGVWAEGLPELTWPQGLIDEIRPILAEGAPDGPIAAEYVDRFGLCPPSWKRAHEREALFRLAYAGDRTHERIFVKLAGEEPADLQMVYFGLTDVAGHFWWKYHEPEAYRYPIPEEQVAFFHDHVRKAYRTVDDWIGEVLEVLPEDHVVMVIADHGMKAYNVDKPNHPQSGGHEKGEPGVFVLSGSGVRKQGLLPANRRRLGDLYDVAPTILDLLGLPACQEMSGRSLRGLMTEEWRSAHPERPRVATPEFRPPQPARVPIGNANEVFMQSFTALGYVGGETEE